MTFAGRKTAWCRALLASPRCAGLVACDADPDAAVRHAVPEFRVVPPLTAARGYLDALLGICARERIDAILPLNDLDLSVLASHADEFEAAGARVLTAAAGQVESTRDKLAAFRFLRRRGIPTPPTLPRRQGREALRLWGTPLAAKARRGQGSAGLLRIESASQLRRCPDDAVLQPWLEGEELHLDLLRSRSGRLVGCVAKRKLAMFQGSTDKAVAIEDPECAELAARLCAALDSMVGSVDCDVLRTCEGLQVLDVNLRLGGGIPFTAICCPAYLDALLEIARGREPAIPADACRVGVSMARDWAYFEIPGN